MKDATGTSKARSRRAGQLTALWHAVIAMIFAAVPALAENWTALDAEAIRAALSDRTVDYDGAWQRFDASGRTLYNAGSDSLGTWEIMEDQYCSQWPPNTDWSCYTVEISVDGARVRFVAPGDVTTGIFR